MAEITPFRALHYNPAKIPDLGKVVTQPYDKISAEMQARYYDLSPHNLVRIIRGRAAPGDTAQENVYSRAARDLHAWIADGILVSEPQPAIYPYYQEYAVPGEAASRKRRRGFIALCRLEDYSAGIVHRHEETLSGPKADRLELLKATRAHFGQVFVLYSDPEGLIEAALAAGSEQPPWERVADEYGNLHSVWRLRDAAIIERVVIAMRAKKLVIADGHHRYETALAYRNCCRKQQRRDVRAEYVLMTFIRRETDGLTILPTHRVVHNLPDFDWWHFAAEAQRLFDWQEVPSEGRVGEWGARFLQHLARVGKEGPAFGAYAGPGCAALLRLRQDVDLASLRRLDMVILHQLVLEGVLGIAHEAVREETNLRYFRESALALGEVEDRRAQLCFLMNPTPVEAVWENAVGGWALPQKSTDFYPKLLSGLAIYWLDNPAGI